MHTARCLLDMSGCVSIMVPSIGQGMIECNNFQNCNAETSKYPGPFLAKVTPVSDLRPSSTNLVIDLMQFPETISLLRGRIPFFMKDCHDKCQSCVEVILSVAANERRWTNCESVSK